MTTYQPKCTFTSSSGANAYSRSGCGQEAVSAVKNFAWRGGDRVETLVPRCKRHASVDRNRTYGPMETIDLTPAILAAWELEAAERAAANEARMAEKRVASDRSYEAAKAREALEHEVQYEVVRDDEKDIDWRTEKVTLVPRWAIRPIGQGGAGYNDMEVKITRREGFPDRVDVRNGSQLTPKAALKLAEAMTLAFGETK